MEFKIKAAMAFAGMLALGAGTVQAQDCQAGTGPVAGFNTETELATAAAATPNVCDFNPTVNAAAKTNLKSVLLMDWSNGQHSKVHTQKHMYRLARKYGFKLTRSQSRTYITASTLEGVDLVVFNNGDEDPINGATNLAAMRDFIETQGKSMFAIHAALAFIPCPNNEDVTVASLTTCRWFFRAYRTQFDKHVSHAAANTVRIYVDSVRFGEVPPNALGADAIPSLINHGIRDSAVMNIFAPLAALPTSQHLPVNGGTGVNAASNRIWDGAWDEWYSYLNHPRRAPVGVYGGVHWGPVKMLLSLDETSYTGNICNGGTNCKTGDRPISWTRVVGNAGLAAYNNAGHGDVYARPRTAPGGTSQVDSLWEIYNWRLMKYLGRDYVGCTNPLGSRYNPQASVRSITVLDSTPGSAVYRGGNIDGGCPAGTSAIISKDLGRIQGIKVVSNGLSVPVVGSGKFDVIVATPQGRVLYSRTVVGGREVAVNVSGLRKGTYIVRITGANKKASVARMVI